MNRRSFVNKLLGLVAIAPAAPAIAEKITTYIPPPAQPSFLLPGTWYSEDAFRSKFEKMFCNEMAGEELD